MVPALPLRRGNRRHHSSHRWQIAQQRQVDSPTVVQSLKAEQLSLDASVWSLDSATFNPPNLIGKVSQRTALEAMIMHSDNTSTDMSIKHAGPDKVSEFIASVGLRNTMIPESTRSLFGYLLNAKDYKTFTWEELGAAANLPSVDSPLNKGETMASTADDFVSCYSRALHGDFFQHKETLNEFRRILSLGDAILASAVATWRQRLHQRRKHRRSRLSRHLRARSNALRQPLGLLLPHHQLLYQSRNRSRHRYRLRRRRKQGTHTCEANALLLSHGPRSDDRGIFG